MNIDTIQTFLGTTAIDLLMKIGAALIFWIVGRWLISKVVHLIQAGMNRNSIDPTLTKYLGSIITIALNITLVLGILGYFGIQTTSFAAMLAGAGVAIGAAWSGMLGNFAAGAFMLVLRPFKVGDFVSIGGVTGTVHELGLFGTTIITPDNVMTIVGNGKVFGDTVQNYSALPVRRVERTAQLAQGVDPLDAITRLKAAIAQIPNVAQSPTSMRWCAPAMCMTYRVRPTPAPRGCCSISCCRAPLRPDQAWTTLWWAAGTGQPASLPTRAIASLVSK